MKFYIIYTVIFSFFTITSQNIIDLGLIDTEEQKILYKEKWFASKYERFPPNTDVLESIKSELLNCEINIVMGTWCHDSKTWVPRYLKLFNALNIPKENIKIYNIDRKKKRPRKYVQQFKIKYVSTLIFSNGGKEIGRIIEYPDETIEKDILKIFQPKTVNSETK